ncbi:MAG: energy transducer TonB [Alteromonadaceae bacterium]|nr:energy transducer TonB [Alteromonadaceae bacterium]
MRYLIATGLLVALAGCQSVNQTDSVSSAQPGAIENYSTINQSINRFPPRYPPKAAMNTLEGCATLEYTLTLEHKVIDIQVLDSDSSLFAKEAVKVISKWDWSALSDTVLSVPVRLQTRFEYCLENSSGRCTAESLASRTNCRGADVVISAGRRVTFS